MSLLTEYLAATDKHKFLSNLLEKYEDSYPYMFGLTSSLLYDLTDLIGNNLALSLSDAKDKLTAMELQAWEEIKRGHDDAEDEK